MVILRKWDPGGNIYEDSLGLPTSLIPLSFDESIDYYLCLKTKFFIQGDVNEGLNRLQTSV